MEQPKTGQNRKRQKKGKANDIDRHVGKRLKIRRSLLGLSQEKLAEAIGLTFQQVQKYERGVNRISAGRLYWFAKILEVNVQYFYDYLPGEDSGRLLYKNQDADIYSDKLVFAVAIDIFELQKINPEAAVSMKSTIRGLLRSLQKLDGQYMLHE